MKNLIFLAILFSLHSNAQTLLKGVVLDFEKSKPVPGASIFLNNTSVGTTADAQGNFSITLPEGKYDLIVSSVGMKLIIKRST